MSFLYSRNALYERAALNQDGGRVGASLQSAPAVNAASTYTLSVISSTRKTLSGQLEFSDARVLRLLPWVVPRSSGMSVMSTRAVQQRLTAIVEALSRAVVVEICELLDGSYAPLCVELERTQRENEDLKKKLHAIEAIVVRCSDGGAGAKAAVPEELGLGSAAKVGQKEPRRWAEDGRDATAPPGGATDASEVSVVQQEQFPDVVLIKDEDSDSDDTSQQDAPAPISHSAKRRRTGNEAGGRKPPPKAAKAAEGMQKRVELSVFNLESPQCEVEGSKQVEKAVLACSNLAEEQNQTTQPGFFGSSAAPEPPSPSNRGESHFKAKEHSAVSHLHEDSHADDDAFGIKLVSVTGSALSDYEAAETASHAPYTEQRGVQPVAGSRRKHFVCCVCHKTYATAQNLDVHMRIHTGVRPFGCEHCGKKFLQSAHLKSHLSIHTGERPHVCLICSRSFIVKYSLKLHMKKCHMSPS